MTAEEVLGLLALVPAWVWIALALFLAHGWSVQLCMGDRERPRLFKWITAFLALACVFLALSRQEYGWGYGAGYFVVNVLIRHGYDLEDRGAGRARIYATTGGWIFVLTAGSFALFGGLPLSWRALGVAAAIAVFVTACWWISDLRALARRRAWRRERERELWRRLHS